MLRVFYFVTACLVGSLGIGWMTAPAPQNLAHARQAAMSAPHHGGARAAAARERFAALGLLPAPPPEPSQPPPPDVAIVFRRDLSAIEQTRRGYQVWVVDLNQERGRRGIRTGGVYQDGWRVASITPQAVVLRRRGEVRRIPVFDPPADP